RQPRRPGGARGRLWLRHPSGHRAGRRRLRSGQVRRRGVQRRRMRPPVDSPNDTHPMPLRIRLAALPVALLAALPAVAQPLRVDYVLGASVLHTDNINLSDDVPESETVVSPEISFTAHQA